MEHFKSVQEGKQLTPFFSNSLENAYHRHFKKYWQEDHCELLFCRINLTDAKVIRFEGWIILRRVVIVS